MKHLKKYIGVSAAILALASTALADTWTSYFSIDGLDNGDNGSLDTLTVSSSGGDFTGSNANPAGCSITTYAYMSPSIGAAAKDLNNRTLMSAFLAGKQVRLRMLSTGCLNSSGAIVALPGGASGGRPVFTFVGIQD